MKKILFLLIISSIFLSNCGIYKRSDIKDNPVNVGDRVDRNLNQGKGVRFFGKGKSGGTFDFASSNPMWQASIQLLDFVTLANASYSGGIIITDWFNDESFKNGVRDIKITIKFLSNEIRADGLQVTVHERICQKNISNSCKISKITSAISTELKIAILQKAAKIEKNTVAVFEKENKRITPRRDNNKRDNTGAKKK